MAISVRLDAKTEQLVRRLAAKRGRGKSSVLREAIALLAREDGEPSRSTPFDAIADLVGSARGGATDLSERTGERFRQLLAARRPRR